MIHISCVRQVYIYQASHTHTHTHSASCLDGHSRHSILAAISFVNNILVFHHFAREISDKTKLINLTIIL